PRPGSRRPPQRLTRPPQSQRPPPRNRGSSPPPSRRRRCRSQRSRRTASALERHGQPYPGWDQERTEPSISPPYQLEGSALARPFRRTTEYGLSMATPGYHSTRPRWPGAASVSPKSRTSIEPPRPDRP